MFQSVIIRRLTLLALLLCLPFQVISATAIDCKHDAGNPSDNPITAPCHTGGDHLQLPPDSNLTDCQKCALYLLLGSTAFSQPAAMPLNTSRTANQPALPHHYYQLFPPHLERPPLSS